MLNDEICKLREKLNESIINNEDYSITYKISVELDELIALAFKRDRERQNRIYSYEQNILALGNGTKGIKK